MVLLKGIVGRVSNFKSCCCMGWGKIMVTGNLCLSLGLGLSSCWERRRSHMVGFICIF